MSSISSIDTSLYSGLIQDMSAVSGRNAPETPRVPAQNSSDAESIQVDLSSYYSNIRPEDLLSTAGNNVVQSAQDLDNAMVSALQNGYSVQDAVNIKLAQTAYQANSAVYEAVVDISV